MTAATMPTTVERAVRGHTEGVSHMLPFLLAIAIFAASAVVSVWLSGPIH